MLEKFIKKAYISFYQDDKYYFEVEIVKNKKVLENLKKEFSKKEELIKEINLIKEDYPQYFISTIITTLNQGTIPSCKKQDYKKREIEIENIKYVCIKNRYSFYVSIYDLAEIKKEFEIDFLYSIFSVIDFFAKKKDKVFYILILKTTIAILGYENNLPIYSEIIKFEEKNEEVEEIDDLDLDVEDLSEDIEEESENLDLDLDKHIDNLEEDIEKNLSTSSIESKILEHLKESLKEYYSNYSNDFLEKIILLDTIQINNSITKIINDELLIETEKIDFNLTNKINKLSESENV